LVGTVSTFDIVIEATTLAVGATNTVTVTVIHGLAHFVDNAASLSMASQSAVDHNIIDVSLGSIIVVGRDKVA